MDKIFQPTDSWLLWKKLGKIEAQKNHWWQEKDYHAYHQVKMQINY